MLKKPIKTYKDPLQKQRKARSCGLYRHELKVHGQKQTDTTIRIAKCRMPLRKTQDLPQPASRSLLVKTYNDRNADSLGDNVAIIKVDTAKQKS